MHGCMVGWMHEWMDGWMDGWHGNFVICQLAVLLQRGPEIAGSVPDRAGHRNALRGHSGPHGGARGVGEGTGAIHRLQV